MVIIFKAFMTRGFLLLNNEGRGKVIEKNTKWLIDVKVRVLGLMFTKPCLFLLMSPIIKV